MTEKDKRAEIETRMAEILDGDAPQELYDAIAESDELRDARHEAEHAVKVAREAGADYVPPADLEQRLLAQLDARATADATEKGGPEQPVVSRSELNAAPDAEGHRARLLQERAPEPGTEATNTPAASAAMPKPGKRFHKRR